MPEHAQPDSSGHWGEAMVPVPRFGRGGEGLVPVRWVGKVICLTVGTTIIVTQFVMWVGWHREPLAAFLTVGVGLMAAPGVISLDERRQKQ